MECKERVREYLIRELRIRLHPYKIYLQHVRRGVTFLGTMIKPHRIYMSNRTTSNLKDKLRKGDAYYADRPTDLMQVLNSYLGLIGHYKTFEWRRKLIEENRWIFNHGWITSTYLKFQNDESLDLSTLEPIVCAERQAFP